MSLKIEIAATVRALRAVRGATYEDLAGVSARKNLGSLEQGKSNITTDRLVSLAEALKMDPVAFLALSVSVQRGESPESTLARAQAQIDEFREKGGIEILQTNLENRQLTKRPTGKPKGSKNAVMIKALKEAGYSQLEAAKKLELSRSTIGRYW